MTEEEMRELDDWIAVNFMGWHHINKASINGYIYEGDSLWRKEWGDPLDESCSGAHLSKAELYSYSPGSFARVKREIERRGWEWAVNYARKTELVNAVYAFTVYVIMEPETNAPRCFDKLADSEELAGCLAVKAALESK